MGASGHRGGGPCGDHASFVVRSFDGGRPLVNENGVVAHCAPIPTLMSPTQAPPSAPPCSPSSHSELDSHRLMLVCHIPAPNDPGASVDETATIDVIRESSCKDCSSSIVILIAFSGRSPWYREFVAVSLASRNDLDPPAHGAIAVGN